MTPKQELFVTEYLKDLNATQAAIRAGYSEKTAYSQGQRLLKNVEVKSAIEQQMKSVNKKIIADAEEVMTFLTDTMRGNTTSQELTNTGEVVEITASMPQRLKAAELMGKRHALFTDKVEQTNTNIDINIGDYEDE
ncbi:terminase small subunit [Lactobacillus terrae]|uniref:terminase small subunit n=1 Tax=Lactobacillus terrae TaxID=2269374 RepID=UPI000C1B6E65|nr:terminase small subunit [Lactobacillus terrae]